MTEKIENALKRLNRILPLKARQENCSEEIKELHQQVLRSFVTKGRILTREEMGQQINNVNEAINMLCSNDMVLFDENGQPSGAYPFTMEEREHKIRVNGYQVHAMCALDALAVSPMFNMDTEIHSQCRVTGEPIHIRQSGQTIENLGESGRVYFGIVWGAADSSSCCADSLCTEMVFLRDEKIARQWLANDPENKEVFDLAESVEFAARFFVPLVKSE